MLWACGGMFIGAACAVADVDLTGKRCPCADGYVCVSGTCLRPGSLEDGALDAPVDAPERCDLQRPPQRPGTTPSEPRLSFLTALRRMDFETPPGFDFPFFDLDGFCTCLDTTATSCVGANVVCDEPGGVDRSLNMALATVFERTNRDVTQGLADGRFGILLRVSDYNGLPEDDSVLVDFIFSAGLDGMDGGAPIPPKFDGTDVYTVLPTSFDGETPRWRTSGYVNGSRLVVALADTVEIDPTVNIPITNSLVVADIHEQDGKRWLSRGTWSGRVKADDFLTVLANLTLYGDPLCDLPAVFDTVREPLCAARDISSASPTPPGAPCNAMSSAAAIEGAPVSGLGESFARPLEPPKCGTDYRASCD